MTTPYRQLELRRGLKADLPELVDGEPGYCEDTFELFIGNATEGNTKPNVDYTPMNPTNWANPTPTTIAQALDRLTAALVGQTGHPIP